MRVLGVIALLIGLPIIVIGQVLTETAQQDWRAGELARVSDGSSAGAALVADRVDNVISRTTAIAATPSIRDLVAHRDVLGLEGALGDLRPLYAGDVLRLFVLDPQGRFVASAPAQRHLNGTDLSRTEYFIMATNPWHAYVSSVDQTPFDDHASAVTIAVPVLDGLRNPIGMLSAVIDLSQGQSWLKPLGALLDEVYVIDSQGRLVFGVSQVKGSSTLDRDLRADPNVLVALGGGDVRTESDDLFSGARRFVAAAPINIARWYAFAAEDGSKRLAALSRLSEGLLVLRLALLAMLAGGGIMLSRTVLKQQRIALANLQRLNKSKSDFVSVVSHEFRTPLTGIQGFSEMIRDEDLTTAEVKEFANDINKDALRLSRMIGELLDLDRMESGRMNQSRARVDLNALVSESVAHERANASHHTFVIELDPALTEVWADHDRIVQVLTNLINNAIKYSPNGGTITVGTARLDDAAHCWVRDEGMGIPAASLELVFERYSRLETGHTRTIQGTGLGLPIVREICQAHGGRVWAENNPGKGSTFHVTLPFSIRDAA